MTERDVAVPGRPRSRRAHDAILVAAGALLRERGLRGMTIEAVAERARVSKKTIYRWWPSKGTLALDAFYREWTIAQGTTPDTGNLERDLRTRIRATVRVLAQAQLGTTVAELIAEAQTDHELAEAYEKHVLGPQRAQLRAIFERAGERGEIAPDADVDAAIDLLQGALYLRLLHTHARLDRAFADSVVSLLTRGALSRA